MFIFAFFKMNLNSVESRNNCGLSKIVCCGGCGEFRFADIESRIGIRDTYSDYPSAISILASLIKIDGRLICRLSILNNQ
jgi:hypothetical protein